jgi:hypothetical protein
MKLLLGSLIAASALALSMLVGVSSTATAAPYPGTVATSCGYASPEAVKSNRQLRVGWRVTAGGNARPSGVMTFRVWRVTRAGNLLFNRAVANGYTGPNFRTRSLGKFKKEGRFVTQMSFEPNNGSVYKSCASGYRAFRVRG